MFVRYVYFHLPNTLLRERARKYTHSNMKLRSGKTTAPRCRRFSHLIKHHIASQFFQQTRTDRHALLCHTWSLLRRHRPHLFDPANFPMWNDVQELFPIIALHRPAFLLDVVGLFRVVLRKLFRVALCNLFRRNLL